MILRLYVHPTLTVGLDFLRVTVFLPLVIFSMYCFLKMRVIVCC